VARGAATIEIAIRAGVPVCAGPGIDSAWRIFSE
jgi:hypothetical protein